MSIKKCVISGEPINEFVNIDKARGIHSVLKTIGDKPCEAKNAKGVHTNVGPVRAEYIDIYDQASLETWEKVTRIIGEGKNKGPIITKMTKKYIKNLKDS